MRRVVLELTNGYLFAFPISAVPALAGATPAQPLPKSLE